MSLAASRLALPPRAPARRPRGRDRPTRALRASRDLSVAPAGPSTPKPPLELSALDALALKLFARALARELESDVDGTIDGVRDACLRLVRESGSATRTRARASRILRSLAPEWAFGAFAAALRMFPGWFAARHAAAVTPALMYWLVGEAEVNDGGEGLTYDGGGTAPTNAFAAVFGGETASAGYKQGVLLKRCRVLEETGCAAVCANVCKHPTQKFFTEEIGLPMTMTPNYETFECQFTYGATPPPASVDAAFKTPCFRQCGVSATLADAQCGNCLSPEEARPRVSRETAD